MILWPCRIVTPSGTYDPAHFSFGDSEAVSILDKQGVVVASLATADRSLVAEGAATGKPNVTQRWQVVGTEYRIVAQNEVAMFSGVRWLVELTTGCGCGGTVTRETDPTELAW